MKTVIFKKDQNKLNYKSSFKLFRIFSFLNNRNQKKRNLFQIL